MSKIEFINSIKSQGYTPYDASINEYDGKFYCIAGDSDKDYLFIGDTSFERLEMNHDNLLALEQIFPFIKPESPAGKPVTMGLGDRLGICTGGQVGAINGTKVFPILAQQSKRELGYEKRTYRQMLDDVAWQVFKYGWKNGYGADGDHLKFLEDIIAAIKDGATMITLDCSDHITNDAYSLSSAEAKTQCEKTFDDKLLKEWENEYLGKTFDVDGFTIYFDPDKFYQHMLTYGETLAFAKMVYKEAFLKADHDVAFEFSIDETAVDTDPCAHYFLANELAKANIKINSMAPRFCGEFQKGIDYIGNLDDFKKDFDIHNAICKKFGYKISVHSGSDKFSVFPIVGKDSNYCFHLKTAGTTWLEALRVIAMCNPTLFRKLLTYSLQHFREALKSYYVTCDPNNVPNPESITDENLPALLNEVDTRQVMHISYGFILNELNPDGSFTFRDEMYKTWRDNSAVLDEIVCKHIEKHLQTLGVK